jgi:hypothetical protein
MRFVRKDHLRRPRTRPPFETSGSNRRRSLRPTRQRQGFGIAYTRIKCAERIVREWNQFVTEPRP